jgi:hypothetical protein
MSENELDQWVTLAIHDAETARLLMVEHGYPEIIIYHMHQAIENISRHFWSRLAVPSEEPTILTFFYLS